MISCAETDLIRKWRHLFILGRWGFGAGCRHRIDTFTSNSDGLVGRAWCCWESKALELMTDSGITDLRRDHLQNT